MANDIHLSGNTYIPYTPQNLSRDERIMAGVQDGRINRREFLDLNQDVRDSFSTFGSCGLTPEQHQMAQLRDLALQRKLATYETGNYNPAILPSGVLQDAQNKHSGQIFEGLKQGTISRQEGFNLMDRQQSLATYGALQPLNQVQADLDGLSLKIAQAKSTREANPTAPVAPLWGYIGATNARPPAFPGR